MPVKSAAQFGMMEAAVKGNAKNGPPANVAQDFLNKTSHSAKSKFAKALVKKKKSKVVDSDNDGY